MAAVKAEKILPFSHDKKGIPVYKSHDDYSVGSLGCNEARGRYVEDRDKLMLPFGILFTGNFVAYMWETNTPLGGASIAMAAY